MSQSFDINVLREEARTRWLKPSEVYYILQNHERFPITHEAPKKPPSGSLFLYNRRVNRYFRRDGHTWRRKKDGRTVGEAHERLKVGNVDSLSCYYAHGEQNPCFQRRCFWMLEPAYEHIVLVQYREVAEGRYYSSQLSNGPPEPLSSLGYPNAICGKQYHSSTSGPSEGSESHQSYSNLSSVTEVSSYSGNKEYNKNDGGLLSIPEVGHTCLQQNRTDNGNLQNKSGLNMALKKIAEQLSLGEDDDDDYIYSNQAHSVGGENQVKQIRQEGTQKGLSRNIAPSWEDVLHSSSGLPTSSIYQQSDVEYQKNSEYHPPERLDSSDLRIQLSAAKRFLLGPEATIDSPSLNSVLRNRVNCVTDTISSYDSRFESSLNPDWQTKTALTFQSNSQDSEIAELFDHGHFEPYSREDTTFALGQTNKFNIREISPEWAFSYEITKVIITGDFLCDPSNLCWAVMFGDSEVPVEIVQPGVLRCYTPLHSSGNLRICITSGNREVCSEFKDFEFRSKPTSSGFTDIAPSSRHLNSSEELLLLAKFARMLLSGNGSPEVPDGDPQSGQCPKLKMNEELWDRLIDELKVGCENPLNSVDWILEELLKSKLQQWLSVKLRGFNGTDSLSKHEQGIIHLISALGYEWALSSVLSAGVGLNFRDSNGWTALHWAAYFGREKMVAALLAAGASATAVTDPTAQDPVGKTAAFLASERGHTGLAGYLSEVSLTSYLASLTIEESDVSKGSAKVEAERAVESISQRSAQLHGGTEDELSMKDSLAAVRNAAQAAARIQNAFRAFSFMKRQQKTARLRDEYGMTQEDIDELAAASRLYHQAHASGGQFYDKAAVSIQKKYKGWKGRKHFLNMRRNAVKVQAHVRGHQVRKKYRTIVSTVSVLEKVILRWRRKGHGLRGFRAEQQPMVEAIEEDDEEGDDFDDDEAVKVFRRQKVDQAVKEAVSRVMSMVDSTEARMQYRRMLEEFRQATVEEPHYTPYKDAMAWLAMGKQRQKGLNHRLMQQAGHKLLGRDEIRQNIMEKILLDRNDGSNCTVFCINGGSGFGKTSLLNVLYNDQELLYAFDKMIWIQMSDKLDILMFFRKIIEFVMNDHCSIMSTDLLQELLMEEITDEKFLLILDDADIEDQQFWNSILEVLNAGARGSVVIMATKSCAVATPRDVTYVHFLNPLSEENKLTIFQQYSGVGTDIQNNPDLVMVAKRLISRFGSNPLNLKAIGGLLCHADTISLEKDMFEESVMPLQVCHDALPVHLKRCLALCSLFPEGYIFDKHHMVLLWISHGCVRPVEGREPEDVGTEYFNELLCRSFFQYSPSHDYKDNKFVMHELIYNVVASVSRDKYFKSEDPMCGIPENVLHCSLISSQFQTVELMHRTEQLKDLQTFLALQPEWKPNSISLPTLNLVGLGDFFLKFTSLETLDLSHTETEELPASIAGLRNLRYLSVNNTNVRALPSELCNLSNLETLEAKHCRFLTELPRDMRKLVKLRHLDLTKELGYVDLPNGIGELTELQTLPVFHVSEDSSRCSISELGSLHNLRGFLWLSGLHQCENWQQGQEANLKDKQRLKDLTLQWHDDGIEIEDEDEDAEDVADEQVLEGLQPHANLQVLTIRGYEGSRFPAWMQGSSSSLPNLVTLTLDSCCNCTVFPAIAHLPSLKSLSVRKMYNVRRLSSNTDTHGTGSAAKFLSLELLNLWEMYGFEELFEEESEGDYCPRLRKVCISRCPDLKRLPRARSLTELVLHCGHQVPDISELASLVSLKIEGFHGVRSFALPAAAALKRLEIRSCKELASVDGLSAALTTVRRIKIAGCPKFVLPGTCSLTT